MIAWTLMTVGVAGIVALTACRGGGGHGRIGSLRAESLGDDPVFLDADLPTVVYAHDPAHGTSFILSDVPVDALLDGSATSGQVIHIELLWVPKAGATPMDASATNVSIHHVILAEGEAGMYGGAGFALPRDDIGDDYLRVTLRDATVRLLESTTGFADPLSPARVTGTFVARHDPLLARKLHRAVSQLMTNRLGKTVYVRRADEGVSGQHTAHEPHALRVKTATARSLIRERSGEAGSLEPTS